MASAAPPIPSRPLDAVYRYANVFRVATGAAGAQRWERLAIPTASGVNVYHWADKALAAQWLAFGSALLNERALWDNALSLDPNVDAGSVAPLLNVCMGAFAMVCNSLNIQWHTLPECRKVYRQYFSGEPDGFPNEPSMRGPLYGKVPNYADDWWRGTSNAALPYCVGTAGVRGIFARRAVELTRRHRNNPNAATFLSLDTVPKVIPWALTPEGAALYTDITAPNVINSVPVFPRHGAGFECKQLREPTRGGSNAVWRDCPALTQPPGTQNDDEFYQGWSRDRNARVRWSNDVCYLPPDELVAFVRAMFSALNVETGVGRNFEQAILHSRAYVVQFNLDAANANGGLESWISALGNRDANLLRQQTAPSPDVQATIAAVGAIGGSVAAGLTVANPLAGAIAALALGAITTIAKFVDMLSVKAPTGVGRDDLGRYKPVFERGWLGGDPNQTDVSRGAPEFKLPAPPAFSTTQAPLILTTQPIQQQTTIGPLYFGTQFALDAALRGNAGNAGNATTTQPSTSSPPVVIEDVLVRDPVTVLLTEDSLGTTTRATWPNAGAKYEQNGAYVRVYETASARDTSRTVLVRKDEFCALNARHPLCTALAPARSGGSTPSASKKSNALPLVLVGALALGGLWYMTRD